MNNRLVIVFVKNIKFGKVKTRLAASIGNDVAFEVYKYLVEITERETEKLTICDLHIYYSDYIDETIWKKHKKFVQTEGDLGKKMQVAFEHGFNLGYSSIIGIGSDLPSLSIELIEDGFDKLETSQLVFGPATDGGYYLLGMKQLYPSIFIDKPWSTDSLLKFTIQELNNANLTYSLIQELNDIDTIEDLKASELSEIFKELIQI